MVLKEVCESFLRFDEPLEFGGGSNRVVEEAFDDGFLDAGG